MASTVTTYNVYIEYVIISILYACFQAMISKQTMELTWLLEDWGKPQNDCYFVLFLVLFAGIL